MNERIKLLLRVILAAFFFIAGILHFTNTEIFAAIVPAILPYPLSIVWVSGVMEIGFAIGLLVTRLRPAIGFWLSLYCLAVLPANVQMAIDNPAIGGEHYQILLYVRIPLQFLLIGIILYATEAYGRLALIGRKAR